MSSGILNKSQISRNNLLVNKIIEALKTSQTLLLDSLNGLHTLVHTSTLNCKTTFGLGRSKLTLELEGIMVTWHNSPICKTSSEEETTLEGVYPQAQNFQP